MENVPLVERISALIQLMSNDESNAKQLDGTVRRRQALLAIGPPARVAGRQKRIDEEDSFLVIVPKCSQIVEIIILAHSQNN
jgi:hypothetical protein